MKKIFILTGEASGDKLASTVIEKIQKGKSELLDEKSSDTKYEIKNIGDLYKKPPKGKVMMVYYYQYLSSEYELEFLKERKKIVFDINNFNGLAVLSEKNKDLNINNESSGKASDTYIEVILSSGKKLSYTTTEQKKLIQDLENTKLPKLIKKFSSVGTF